MREYDALVRVWEDAREFQTGLFAALRADLHNTSSRDYGQVFAPAEFMPGATREIEDRIAELVELGWNPAAAAAAVTSKQTKDRKLRLLENLKGGKPAGTRTKQRA